MLVSGVQQRDSVIHIHVSILFRFLSHVGYCRVLSRVPCALQQVLWEKIWSGWCARDRTDAGCGSALLLHGCCLLPFLQAVLLSKLKARCHVGHSGTSNEPRLIYKPTGKAPELLCHLTWDHGEGRWVKERRKSSVANRVFSLSPLPFQPGGGCRLFPEEPVSLDSCLRCGRYRGWPFGCCLQSWLWLAPWRSFTQ